MLDKIVQETEKRMQQALVALEEDLRSIRTGRATSALVEGVTVSNYGSVMPLQQVASITTPDANMIVVQPWDKNLLGDIDLAIRNANLGINPVNDGQAIRLVLPPLTEERRHEFVKSLHQKAEAGRIALRNIRGEAWEKVQSAEKKGDLTEDDRDVGKEKLNKLVDEYNHKVQEVANQKETAIMKI